MKKELVLTGWDDPIEMETTGRRHVIAKPFLGLAGHSFTLAVDDGEDYSLHFLTSDVLTWNKCGEEAKTFHYLSLCASANVCLVNFIDGCRVVSIVLDIEKSLTTLVFAYANQYPKRPKLMRHVILFGAIRRPGQPLPLIRHSYTSDMVGKKIAWNYSPVVTLTHLYATPYSLRSSLKNMKPLPPDATPEQRADCENRAERWGSLFFEEPCTYIKIGKDMYLILFRESNRNRIDPSQGGGDMLLIIDTARVRDVGRSASSDPDGPHMKLLNVQGTMIEEPDENESAPSFYWV